MARAPSPAPSSATARSSPGPSMSTRASRKPSAASRSGGRQPDPARRRRSRARRAPRRASVPRLGRALELLDRVAAVDDDALAGHVARAVRGEERDDRGDLGRACRIDRAACSRPPIASSGSCDPLAIQPGRTAFTVTPRRPTSIARPRMSPVTPGLRRAVDGGPGIAHERSGDRRDEDDPAAARGDEGRQRGPGDRERGPEVPGDAPVPLVRVQVGDLATSPPARPTATIPALLTRMSSRPPWAASTSATSRSAASSTMRSPTWPVAAIPSALSSATRSWIRSVVEAIATRAPPRPRTRAVAKPIPFGLTGAGDQGDPTVEPPRRAIGRGSAAPSGQPGIRRVPSSPFPGRSDHLVEGAAPGRPAEHVAGAVVRGDEDRWVARPAGRRRRSGSVDRRPARRRPRPRGREKPAGTAEVEGEGATARSSSGAAGSAVRGSSGVGGLERRQVGVGEVVDVDVVADVRPVGRRVVGPEDRQRAAGLDREEDVRDEVRLRVVAARRCAPRRRPR